MYWRAEPMMTSANGVRIGHQIRSFQSVQKSQSPANSNSVMSQAAPTMNAALSQKTASHFRSIHRYGLSTSAFNRSNCCACSSCSSVVVIPLPPLTALPEGNAPPLRGRTQFNEEPPRVLGDDGLPPSSRLRLFDLRLDAQQPDDRLRPEGEDARRQPPVEHEWPVERSGEDLLGDPEAVAPFVHGHLHHLGDRRRDEEEEGPGEAHRRPVDLGQPV